MKSDQNLTETVAPEAARFIDYHLSAEWRERLVTDWPSPVSALAFDPRVRQGDEIWLYCPICRMSDGGSHWHCPACGGTASMYGHIYHDRETGEYCYECQQPGYVAPKNYWEG